MNSISNRENLFKDRVYKLSENITYGVGASFSGAVIIALVVRNVVGHRQFMLWVAGLFFISTLRLILSYYFKKLEKNIGNVRRYRILFLMGLTATGLLWGSTALWSFPAEQLAGQTVVIFVLGGMVAGSVGIYSVMLSAFFFFSVPTLFPMVLKLFIAGGQVNYAMGLMLLVYWFIMLATAVRLNRDITGYLLIRYENLDLIFDLEAEMRVRKAAEDDLKKKNQEIEGIVTQRTEALLESKEKLIREIEERQVVSAALEENEEKYREMVESINEVIYAADGNGVVNYISPVARTVLGYGPEELVGKNFKDYVYGDDLKMFSAVLSKRMAGNTRPIEYRFRTKTGGYRWVRGSSRAVFKEGTFLGIRGVLTDISEKRKLEEQLRLTQKMEAITTLSGGIAHDFNNLLAVILGNTELAMLGSNASPSVHLHLEKIVDSSLKAREIVKELLSFARKSYAARKPIDIGAAVRKETRRLKSKLPASVVLEEDIQDDIWTVIGDNDQIGQVVANLWDNAVEAMSDGGGILTVAVKNAFLETHDIDFDSDMAAGRYVQLSVRDTGRGIHPDNIDRLFDPYYTTREFGSGYGLGLAVVHGVVKRHGGGIRVTSAPGKGTCLDSFFPEMTL